MSVYDILNAANEKNASAFADAVKDELNDRIANAIDAKRVEVASSIFDDEDEEEYDEEDYEDDEDFEEEDEEDEDI